MSRPDGQHLILLGTHDVYVHSVIFDERAKTLTQIAKTQTSEHPSWLTRHPLVPDIIYSNGHVQGKVFANRLEADGKLTVLDEAKSGGAGPTHLAVSADKSALLIAHYGEGPGGLLASLPLSPDGRFQAKETDPKHFFRPEHDGRWKHPRLSAPHVHHIIAHGDEVITCDLGSNVVWRLRQMNGGWEVLGQVDGLNDGDGPRHAVVSPNGKYIYVLNEVSSDLTVHTLPSSGPSELISRFPLRPLHDQDNNEMTAGEIVLLPPLTTGGPSLLLATNRFSTSDKGDAIALFTVDNDGTVKPTTRGWYHGVGKHIRALEGDKSGQYIVTAGRDEGGVVILERTGQDGVELSEVARLDIPHVVVPVWID